jgi:hypothetical protein
MRVEGRIRDMAKRQTFYSIGQAAVAAKSSDVLPVPALILGTLLLLTRP